MMIQVRLFARARDLAGADTLSLELPAGATVAELRTGLAKSWPSLERLLAHSRLAVGNDFVADETKLTYDAFVAVIPPVSGG
jgi:molybdopterin converting factor subunit 1